MHGYMSEISPDLAKEFILPKHYSGRTPQISVAFGWFTCEPPLFSYESDYLMAVCTFGKPASPSLCDGVCGKEWSSHVYELNRLCRTDECKEQLSEFVSWCLRELKKKDWIIISYSDTAMNHHGYIYQACNFLYTGATKERTDMYSGGNKHSRHCSHTETEPIGRIVRSSKHRYIFFCTSNKKLKKKWLSALNYPISDYPKGDNSPDYTLGEFLKPNIVENKC